MSIILRNLTEKYGLTEPVIKIIDVFCGQQFRKLTLKEIAERLNEKPDTIRKRIDRNNLHDLFLSDNSNPKNYWIKRGEDYITFHSDHFRCRDCRQVKDGSELTVQYFISNRYDAENYNNKIAMCKQCVEKRQSNIKSQNLSITNFSPNNDVLWTYEYKEIQLDMKLEYKGHSLEPSGQYLDIYDGQVDNKYFHITEEINGVEKIVSRNRAQVLNIYGKQGWNAVRIWNENEDFPDDNCSILFKRKIPVKKGG